MTTKMEEIIVWVEARLFPRHQMVHLLSRTMPPQSLQSWLTAQGERDFAEQAFSPDRRRLISEEALEARIKSLVEANPALLESLLRAWAALSPPPPVLRDLRALRNDRLLQKRRDIVRRHQPDFVILALICEERLEALKWLCATGITRDQDPTPYSPTPLTVAAVDALQPSPAPTDSLNADSLDSAPISPAFAKPFVAPAPPKKSSWVDEEHDFLLNLAIGDGFFDFILTHTDAKALWQWLQDPAMEPLRRALEQDAAPNLPRVHRDTLHLPAARRRLLHHINALQEEHSHLGSHLIWAWRKQRPTPPVLTELRSEPGLAGALEALPRLRARFGTNAVLAALFAEMRSYDHTAWLELLGAARALSDADALAQPPSEIGQTPHSSVAPTASGRAKWELGRKSSFEIELRSNTSLARELRLHEVPSPPIAPPPPAEASTTLSEVQAHLETLSDPHSRRLTALEIRLEALLEKSARDDLALQNAHDEIQTLRAGLEDQKHLAERRERVLTDLQQQNATLRAEWEAEIARRERAERRARSLESQLESERQLFKRTRRQLQSATTLWRRRALSESLEEFLETQEISAQVVAPLPAEPETLIATPDPKRADPWQLIGEWQHEGRRIALAPRELQRWLRRGDEAAVFALSQAWQQHETKWPLDHARWREQLENLDPLWGPYALRILEADDAFPALVDASNVARARPDEHGRGRLQDLVTMLSELRCQGAFPLQAIADASLPHFIDDRAGLRVLVERGEVELTPSGTEADEWLTRRARQSSAFVITNDRHFHKKVAPSFEPLRVGFNFDEQGVQLDEF